MLWFWLAVLGGILGSVRFLLSRVIMRDEKEGLICAFIYQSLNAFLIIPLLGFNFKLPRTFLPFVVVFLIGVLDSLAVFLIFESAKLLEASLRKIVVNVQIVWVLFLGVFLLQESLDLAKILGVSLILGGVVMAGFEKKKSNRFKGFWLRLFKKETREKGIVLILVGTALKSFESLVIKKLLVDFSAAIIGFGIRLSSAICLLLVIKNLKPRATAFVQRKRGLVFVHGLTGTLAFFLFLWATSLTEVSRTVPIIQSFSVLTVLAGIVFLNERERLWQKVLGGLLAAVGVVLVRGF